MEFIYECGNDTDFILVSKENDEYIISIGKDVDLNTTDVVTIENLSVTPVNGESNDINDFMDNNGCNRNDCTYTMDNNGELVTRYLPIDYIGVEGINLKEINIDQIKLKCYIMD